MDQARAGLAVARPLRPVRSAYPERRMRSSARFGAAPPALYVSRARRARGRSSLAQRLTWLTIAATCVLMLAGAIVDRAYQSRVLPGVATGAASGQQPLTGLTHQQVVELLRAQTGPWLAAPAVFALNEREWRPAAGEMGIGVDTDRMAREALAYGRTGPGVFRWPEAVLALLQRRSLPLRATIDETQLAAFLSAVALEVDRNPVNALLQVRNGQVLAGKAETGQQLDIPATIKRVHVPRYVGDVQRIQVVVNTLPPVLNDIGVAEARAQAERMLAAPQTLRAGERTFTLTPVALGNMLDIQPVDGPGPSAGKLIVALNQAKVAAYVKTLAASIDVPAVDAQLRWTGNGVAVTRESRDGIQLDQAAAVKAIIGQAARDSREVTLVTTVTKPNVSSDNVAQLGIKELVATGSSKFAGSGPERVNNIQVAASRLNGTVIPPGATFSFLKALGPITKANGYQEGLTILGDETVPGIGGGVCQVSTTLFRAAFFTGLPFVERHQHTYRVGYYEQDGSPVGFDAAVYDPGIDLRFKNDLGMALLIQMHIDPDTSTLTFRLYGTAEGRDVRLAASRSNEIKAGPPRPDGVDPTLPRGQRRQVEWRADGVDATIRRTVVQSGRTLLSDSFFSRYAPWREKWVVGIGPV
ncbi:MAG: VanW family protein [Chloroflexi bacterium]|nr:VanW family protein [Chloroflexota bacterium]